MIAVGHALVRTLLQRRRRDDLEASNQAQTVRASLGALMSRGEIDSCNVTFKCIEESDGTAEEAASVRAKAKRIW